MTNNTIHNVSRELYTCIGKGGVYEHIGLSAGAGMARGEQRQVYRCTTTGLVFHRECMDFKERMERLSSQSPAGVDADHVEDVRAMVKAQCVVMPERWNVPRPMWEDARQPYGNPLNHADIEAAEKFNLALDEVARLNAAPVQQVSVPAISR